MNRFKVIVANEASKTLDVVVHVEQEETNIDSTNLTVQGNPDSIEVKLQFKQWAF